MAVSARHADVDGNCIGRRRGNGACGHPESDVERPHRRHGARGRRVAQLSIPRDHTFSQRQRLRRRRILRRGNGERAIAACARRRAASTTPPGPRARRRWSAAAILIASAWSCDGPRDLVPLQRQGDRRVVQRDEQLGARRAVVSLRRVLHAPRLRLRRRRRPARRHQRHAERPSRVEPGALRHDRRQRQRRDHRRLAQVGHLQPGRRRPSSRLPASIRCMDSPGRAR